MGSVWWGQLDGVRGVWGAGKGAACVLGWVIGLMALTCYGDHVEMEQSGDFC